MAALPNDTNIDYPTYSGNVGSLMGRTLGRGDIEGINSSLGLDHARSNYNFIQNGNIYRVGGAFDEPNTVTLLDTVANRQQMKSAQEGKTKMDNMFTQGKNDITDFLGRYKTGVGDAIASTDTKYGIPDQISGVNALNARIQDLKTNSSNTGAGGYSTAGQVDSAVNNRYLPQFNTAITNLTTSETQAQNERAALTKPLETEGSLLNDRLAREMSGFTAEQQRELDSYIAKLQSSTQLSVADIQAANALAVAEKNYQGYLAQANANVQAARIGQQYKIIPAGDTLYNTNAGSNNTYRAA